MNRRKIRSYIRNLIKEFSDKFDYKGEHQAPHSSDNYSSPIHDMTSSFGEDIYGPNAVRYFGQGSTYDTQAISIIKFMRNRPNAELTVYRAIPKVLTVDEKIAELEKHKAYIMKYGTTPKGVNNWQNSSEYYEFVSNEIDRLKDSPKQDQKLNKINDGDWVTTVREYAVEHGKSHLNNNYKILSKKVKARNVYGNGDSVLEFGYSA